MGGLWNNTHTVKALPIWKLALSCKSKSHRLMWKHPPSVQYQHCLVVPVCFVGPYCFVSPHCLWLWDANPQVDVMAYSLNASLQKPQLHNASLRILFHINMPAACALEPNLSEMETNKQKRNKASRFQGITNVNTINMPTACALEPIYFIWEQKEIQG